ncbi:myosin-M heavy chain-like [Uloborus diversus]|uniref:myosin-M heavy chain-like n=1 Tax=Uloborus diversus TaxID=327109 RepID=UPI0024095351|nr:myosin-M heavy chain-like [Uloborus diversus]
MNDTAETEVHSNPSDVFAERKHNLLEDFTKKIQSSNDKNSMNDTSVLTLGNGTDNRVENRNSNQNTSITCTIITNHEQLNRKNNSESQELFHNTVNVSNSKGSEIQSSDEEDIPVPDVEGPLYSNLLYVPRKSPSPPPLPNTLPPLPPKRMTSTLSIPIRTKEPKLEGLYDVVPLPRTNDDNRTIYESRRYSDTGATVVTISSGIVDEPIYASVGGEAIYEELPEWRGSSMDLSVSMNPFGVHRRSFFEGASKAEILKFLEVAKERVVDNLEDDILDEDEDEISQTKNVRNNPIRISSISSSSDSSTISSNSSTSRSGNSSDENTPVKANRPFGTVEIERTDSGVGSETGKPIVARRHHRSDAVEELCADCDEQMEENGNSDNSHCCPLVCKKCDKKRSERKEIVTEIVETEFKYGKDLEIIREEFKTPMEVAGLLTKEQLAGVFLNLDELILVNENFSEKLKDAVDIAVEQGDEDYTTVNIGKLFLETTTMLQAFEVYCIRQGSASVLLTNLEKEKELLRIFLKVSQMENSLLRRMNLSAFLMVPVQRVTKYPLLLNRLYKVTPYHHKDREALREAQLKIELHLEQINQQTKGITGTKIWRRISNISATHRRSVNVSEIGSIQLRKMAIEVLGWSKEDIRFAMAGKLSFSGAVEVGKSTRRGRGAVRFTSTHALLATKGRPNGQYRPDLAREDAVLFPRDTGIEDATLLLVKEKGGKYSLARDPLHLGFCVISSELEDEDIIEIQEYTTKESVFLKAECKTDTTEWLKQLKYHAKDLGTWKRRRNALANIMINGMIHHHRHL